MEYLIADSLAAIACQCCVGPWALLQSNEPHHHDETRHALSRDAMEAVYHALKGHYGEGDVVREKDGELTVRGNTGVKLEEEVWHVTGEEKDTVMKIVEKLMSLNVISRIKGQEIH